MTRMENYQAVRSGLDIGRSVADYWERAAPNTTEEQRTKRIRAVNDVLQGRSAHTVEELFGLLGTDTQGDALRRDILDFLAQKERLDRPYTSEGVMADGLRLAYRHNRDRPSKVIDQATYDRAAKEGFPLYFFRESYFDRVTLYCLPEYADCNFSYFDNCSFQVCRISGATFDGATLTGCAFHTARLDHVTFFSASLTHTHFRDSSLNWVSFQTARLKSCSTIDCILQNVGFLNASLDGCVYGRITAENTRCLHTAQITQSGATEDECAQNRAGILQSLCPKREVTPSRAPEKRRGGR